MANINIEPEYYLARCTGNDYEKTEAAEFHRQYQSSDRDIVLKGLLAADAPAELIELVESGADISRGDEYRAITEVLTNQAVDGACNGFGGLGDQDMTFPITIRCSNPDEFSQSEQGSCEDALDRGEDVSDHPYTVLGKLQTRIRIENREQLRNIWYACCTGTFQYNHARAAQTVHSQLKPYIEEHAPEDLNRYGYPCGL